MNSSAAHNGTEVFSTSSEGFITPASVIAVGAVLGGLDILAVALRFYSKRQRSKHFAIDDWFILASLFLTIGLALMMIVGSALGGLSQPTPQGNGPKGYLTAMNDSLMITEKIFWIFDLVQCFAFGTAKLSVLHFYRTIFPSDTFYWLSWTLIGVVYVWTFGFFFAILFRCGTQFWALWAPLKDLLANCYQSTPMFQAFTISDVITDFLILSLPIYWILKLRLDLSKRLAVCGVFLLGALVLAAGIARLVIFIQQTRDPYQNADGNGHLTTEIYWSMLEMGISVIAACLPTIYPLVSKVSLDQIVRSVRSMLSLESLTSLPGSQRSRRAAQQESNKEWDGGSIPISRPSASSSQGGVASGPVSRTTSAKEQLHKADDIYIQDVERQAPKSSGSGQR